MFHLVYDEESHEILVLYCNMGTKDRLIILYLISINFKPVVT